MQHEAGQADRPQDAAAQRLLQLLRRQPPQQVGQRAATETGQDFAFAPGYAQGCRGRLAKTRVIASRQHRLHLQMAE